MTRILVGADGKARCHWCAATPDYLLYHDTEWGFPVDDDTQLFEKLSLEGFQSGLSWRTILAKRDNFRVAFRGFDIDAVARFTARDVTRLLGDAGIVRHRGKIEAVIGNARATRRLATQHGSLAAFIWSYAPTRRERVASGNASIAPQALALSKALKKLGFRFVGPTTVHAFMQAAGLINDHAEKCAIRVQVERARRRFKMPATQGQGH